MNQNDQPKQKKDATIAGYIKLAETKEGQSGPYRRCRVVFGKGEDAEWVTVRIPVKLLDEANLPDPEKGDFIEVSGLLTLFGNPKEAYVFAQTVEQYIPAAELPAKPAEKPVAAASNRRAAPATTSRTNGYQRTARR